MLRLVELFAGTGAFSLAFEETGRVETVFANDIEVNSKKIYEANFSSKFYLGNIENIQNVDIPKMDILTAGFPCQPFSIAGKKMGFNDARSNVFWKIISIIEHHQPRCVVLENVKNLLSHENGNTFKIITEAIQKTGYSFTYKVLNTSIVTNIPQSRERIYIVCFRDKEKVEFPSPTVQRKKISDFLEEKVPQKYYYAPNCKIWPKLQEGVVKHISEEVIYQYRRYYVRENQSKVCPTLTANMGTGGHNVPIIKDDYGIRKLTPRECFNLQGFPSTYSLSELSNSSLYKLAGNAVSVGVVKLLTKMIVESLLD